MTTLREEILARAESIITAELRARPTYGAILRDIHTLAAEAIEGDPADRAALAYFFGDLEAFRRTLFPEIPAPAAPDPNITTGPQAEEGQHP